MLIVLLFWASIPFSLLVSIYGVWKNIHWLVVLGALLYLPIAYYLSGSPMSRGLPLLLPLFQVGAAAAVRAGKKMLAWVLLAPPFLAVFWFLAVVIQYHTS